MWVLLTNILAPPPMRRVPAETLQIICPRLGSIFKFTSYLVFLLRIRFLLAVSFVDLAFFVSEVL